MTTTPPEAPSGPPPYDRDTGPRVDRDQVRDLGRLRRTVVDRKIAGVAGGLARHLDVDPLILRVAFVVLVFFGGAGLILYGACWLLVPEEGSDRAPLHVDERTRSVALIIVGVLAALALIGDSWGGFGFPWPVAIVGLIVLIVLTRNGAGRQPAPPGPTAYRQPPPVAPTQENPYAGAPHPGHQPPPPAYVPPSYATPTTTWVRDPRKRGPLLFWFTLALIALSEGVLGIVDLAGTSVADSAYPALAVGVSGVMLLVGAFFGRAGGIILLGLLATIGLTFATAADRWEGESLVTTPTSAAAVDDRYWLGAGEQVLDLRQVPDLERLDGRTVEIHGGAGRIEVILPGGLAADVTADIDGPGDIALFGRERGGIDITQETFDGSTDDPEITIDAQLGIGQIEVHR